MPTHVIYDDEIFSSQEYGGISRYLCELARRVNRFPQFRAEVIAPLHSNAYLRECPEVVFGSYIKRPRHGVGRRLCRGVNACTSQVMTLIKKPDVVHQSYYRSWLAAPRGAARIITIHDMIPETFYKDIRRAQKTSELKRASVKQADHVICVSRKTQLDLVEILGVPVEKTTVVHHGFSRSAASEAITVLISGERPFFLFVGTRGGYKNFEGMMKAFASSALLRRETRVVCFGGGAFTASEQDFLRKIAVNSANIQQVSGDDDLLGAYYASALAFVYPSICEGFGLPPLEAMGNGCAVACSRASSIPEVVGQAGAYFDPLDADDLRAALEKIYMSEDYRKALIRAGRERLSYFSWDKCAEETIAVYLKALGR